MRILLLEDEEAIRGFVRINLKRNGMEVVEAEDGETALALAESASPLFDAALLDVMLPTISGFDVCERLRERFPRMGIIMLTAKSQEEDKIRGLELGADDYVQKPFSPGELIARLKSLHRRMMPGGLTWPEQASTQSEPGGGAFGTANGANGGGGTSGAADGASGDSGASRMANGASEGSGASGAVNGAGIRGEASHSSASTGGAAGEEAAFNGSKEDKASGEAASSDGIARVSAATSGMPLAGDLVQLQAQGGAMQAVGQPRQPMDSLLSELRSGPFRLSAVERRLWKNDVEIVLTPTEWTLVKLLLEREGAGLSRDDILDEVWGRHFIGDLKIVDVNIRRIRTKIEDEPSEPKYIETLWGYGYRWKRSEGQ